MSVFVSFCSFIHSLHVCRRRLLNPRGAVNEEEEDNGDDDITLIERKRDLKWGRGHALGGTAKKDE